MIKWSIKIKFNDILNYFFDLIQFFNLFKFKIFVKFLTPPLQVPTDPPSLQLCINYYFVLQCKSYSFSLTVFFMFLSICLIHYPQEFDLQFSLYFDLFDLFFVYQIYIFKLKYIVYSVAYPDFKVGRGNRNKKFVTQSGGSGGWGGGGGPSWRNFENLR